MDVTLFHYEASVGIHDPSKNSINERRITAKIVYGIRKGTVLATVIDFQLRGGDGKANEWLNVRATYIGVAAIEESETAVLEKNIRIFLTPIAWAMYRGLCYMALGQAGVELPRLPFTVEDLVFVKDWLKTKEAEPEGA